MTDLLPDLAPAPVSPSALPSPAPDNPAEALSWLGGTVEEVAEGLRARGIKGQQSKITQCPVAQYLNQWWHGSWAGPFDIRAGQGTFDTPSHIHDFMYQFDAGAFPNLIAD